MKIVKALNKNMILVYQDTGQVPICQGKGIGLHKRVGDDVDGSLIERRFPWCRKVIASNGDEL